MEVVEGFDFGRLTFNDRGKLKSGQELDAFVQAASDGPATDAIFIAHGFRNNADEATTLYTNFLRTLRAHLARPEFHEVAARRFVVAGVYWPSKKFQEIDDFEASGTRGLHNDTLAMAEAKAQLEDLKKHDATPAQKKNLEKAIQLLPNLEGNPAAQDEFVTLILSLVKRSRLDNTEGMPQLRKRPGSEVLARLGAATGDRSRGIGDVVTNLMGGVGHFLNLTTWYVMKDRSGAVGATGVADAVRAVRAGVPGIRVHLVGHSLGGRLMASCAKALCGPPLLRLDSLTLLEAALSHFAFSPDNGHKVPGFFREVITTQIVKGPFVATFSAQDTVVGKAYSIMSRLAGDKDREIGDASDEFGGIGRNGPLRTAEVASSKLRLPGTAYEYKLGVINSLDGSGGLIKNHGDVTNEAITYAFASALALT